MTSPAVSAMLDTAIQLEPQRLVRLNPRRQPQPHPIGPHPRQHWIAHVKVLA